MIKKYRKKPLVIEALLWQGDAQELEKFCPTAVVSGSSAFLKTLEGEMEAQYGDYIIKGVKGEFYPCKPDIFKSSYISA